MVKLIPAKCPSCGANLQMPDNLEIGYCTHCGGKVIIDKEKVLVHHMGSVSSVPLCPNCGNTLADGNRQFKCELCGKTECHYCCMLTPRESQHFITAESWGRLVHNNDLTLCKTCAKQRYVTCTSCDSQANGRYSGTPNGKCPHCRGLGTIGVIFKETCPTCDGSGICPTCGGKTWVRLL